jgi:predicted GNAT family N-acyltransferase
MNDISFKLVNNGIPKEAIKIRHEVFQVEEIFIDDLDKLDKTCFHLMMYLDKKAIGTCRFYVEKEKTYHLGRFAIDQNYRHHGYGSLMLKKAEEEIKKLGGTIIELDAQYDKRDFYLINGYKSLNLPLFLDENYPHIHLIKYL